MNKEETIFDRTAALEKQFKEHRLTPQRRLILDVFLTRDDRHLSADEVFGIIREQKGKIGIATVYRNLDLMAEMGLLNKINFGDGRSRYELAYPRIGKHHHLICLRCHEIFEVKADLLHQLEEQVQNEHYFTIVDHHVQFYGYCSACQKQIDKNANKTGQ